MNIPLYDDLSNRLNPDCYTVGRGFDAQGKPNAVLCLVCHNTAGPDDFNKYDAQKSQVLSNKAANYLASNDRQASAHFLVGAENCGAPIYLIVPTKDTAYHAGGTLPTYPSSWKDPTSGFTYTKYALNQVSIGVELFGQPNEPVGANQRAALFLLVKELVTIFPILRDPIRTVGHFELEGDRTDGRNWRDLARGWIAGGFNMSLPYGATIDTTGNIHVNGFIVGFGFRDYWIKMAGADPNAVISSATITRAARVWGLPLENEHTDVDGIARQRFQRYIMNYDKNQTGDWQFSGQFIN